MPTEGELSTLNEATRTDGRAAQPVRMLKGSPRLAGAASAAVVMIGVLTGILLGTFFAVGKLLADLARPHDALLRRRPGSSSLSDLGDDESGEGLPGLVAYRASTAR